MLRTLGSIVGILFAMRFTVAAAANETGPCDPEPVRSDEQSIGVASIEADGTIVLQLRTRQGGMIAEGVLRYPPSDPQYPSILEHLGGLRQGESKSVRPWD